MISSAMELLDSQIISEDLNLVSGSAGIMANVILAVDDSRGLRLQPQQQQQPGFTGAQDGSQLSGNLPLLLVAVLSVA